MENDKELLMQQPDGTEVEFEKAIVVNLQGKYDASVHFFNCEAEDFLSAAYAVLTILDKFGIKDEFLSRYDENSSNCKIYGGRYNGGDEDCPELERRIFGIQGCGYDGPCSDVWCTPADHRTGSL